MTMLYHTHIIHPLIVCELCVCTNYIPFTIIIIDNSTGTGMTYSIRTAIYVDWITIKLNFIIL